MTNYTVSDEKVKLLANYFDDACRTVLQCGGYRTMREFRAAVERELTARGLVVVNPRSRIGGAFIIRPLGPFGGKRKVAFSNGGK